MTTINPLRTIFRYIPFLSDFFNNPNESREHTIYRTSGNYSQNSNDKKHFSSKKYSNESDESGDSGYSTRRSSIKNESSNDPSPDIKSGTIFYNFDQNEIKCDFIKNYSDGFTKSLESKGYEPIKKLFESIKSNFDKEILNIYENHKDNILILALISYYRNIAFEELNMEDNIELLVNRLTNMKSLEDINALTVFPIIDLSNIELIRLPIESLKFFKGKVVELNLSKTGLKEELKDINFSEIGNSLTVILDEEQYEYIDQDKVDPDEIEIKTINS